METEIRIMTHDQKFEILMKYRPGNFSFALRPANEISNLSNTKYYAFAGDLIFQLKFLGYAYAEKLIRDNAKQLPAHHLRLQTV